MKYRKEIDGLRALAVLSVIFYHAKLLGFHAGFVGVDVFFVISGYLISSIVFKELEDGVFSIVHFYERRIRRILPALFLVLMCCIPFAWHWLMPRDLVKFSQSLVAACLMGSNFLFWKETGYYEPDNQLQPLLHTWSLAVEEQFYLFFPLLFLIAGKWHKKGLWVVTTLVLFLSFSIMLWLHADSSAANFYLLPSRVWEFLFGVLLALSLDTIQKKTKSLSPLLLQTFSVLGMTLLVASLFLFYEYDSFPNLFTLVPIIGSGLILLFARPNTLAGKLLSISPLVGIGRISYSAYLWHQPLFAFARHILLKEPDPWVYTFLIVIGFILSYFSWRFVEQPLRSTKSIFKTKSVFISSAIFSVVFITIGSVGIYQRGFPSRLATTGANFEELFKKIPSIWIPLGHVTFIGMGYNHTTDKFRNTEHFISEWKSLVSKGFETYSPILATFGDSHAGNIAHALSGQGLIPLHLHGTDCPISPGVMNERCKKLALTFKEVIKQRPSIKYLALIRYFKEGRDLDLKQIKKTIEFWKDTKLQILFFSGWPDFPNIKEVLERGGYPKPRFDSAELSLRQELKDYLTSEGVHLVNTKAAFCKLTPSCTFKLGAKLSFDLKDMLVYDEHHLSYKGAAEVGRVLIETDSRLKQILNEYKSRE